MSYRSIGLVRNPFTTDGGEGVVEQLRTDRGLPGTPPIGPGTVVEVVGTSGAGKTWQLLRWAQLIRAPYHYTPPGLGRWRIPQTADVLLWDEADRAPLRRRRQVWGRARRQGGSVIVGCHRTLAGEAREAGLSVITFELAQLTPGQLAKWAKVRAAAVAVGGVPAWIEQLPFGSVAARSGASLVVAADLLHVEVARLARGTSLEAGSRLGLEARGLP